MKKSSLLIIMVSFFIAATCNKAAQSDACIDPSKIDPDAVCIEIYQPVCGCNGKTYPNDCYAQKDGVTEWTEGEC